MTKPTTLDELIAIYEADQETYELLFSTDYARLVLRSDSSEIARIQDERCAAIAMTLLADHLGIQL